MSENTVYDTIAEEKMIRQKDDSEEEEDTKSVSQVADIERPEIGEEDVRDAQTWG
jgi:hypothetical protein